MAVTPNWLQNVDYPARIDRVLYDNLWEQGVIGATSFAVTQRGTPSMAVDVAAGVAIVTGTDQSFQGKYLCRSEAPDLNMTIAAAPGSGTRYDIVVVQVRDTNAGGPAGDDARVFVVQGTASATPVDPTLPTSSIPLARVRVPAGTGSITDALIDNLRVEARVIGATPPSGSVMAFAGSTAPSGWLLCDGTAYSQTLYPALFAMIGNTYATSGGQSAPAAGLFRVPILTGRVPTGRDASQTEFDALGETGGAKTHTLTTAEMPSHTHTQDAHNHSQNAHNHTQDAHNHTQDAHSHSTVDAGSHSHGGATGTTGNHQHSATANQTSATSHTHVTNGTFASGLTGSGGTTSAFVGFTGDHAHSIGTDGNHGHTINGATATNQAVTPTNQATTAVNNATTGINQSTGGGAAHPILAPYLVLNYIVKT
jgi:microcystin-dependent protein